MEHLIPSRDFLRKFWRKSLPPPSLLDDTRICSRCAHISLPELFSGNPDSFALKHQGLNDMTRHCELCSILKAIWPPSRPRKSCATIPGTQYHMEMLVLGAQETDSPIDRLLVFSEDKSDDFDVGPSNWNFRRSIFEVSPDCLLDTSINYTQLKSWIENCNKEHTHLLTCCATSDGLSPDGFQLLDVRTGDVAPGQGKTYAALPTSGDPLRTSPSPTKSMFVRSLRPSRTQWKLLRSLDWIISGSTGIAFLSMMRRRNDTRSKTCTASTDKPTLPLLQQRETDQNAGCLESAPRGNFHLT